MKSRKQEPGGERCLKIGAWSTSFALAILLVGCTQQAQQQIEDTGKAVVVDVQEQSAQAVKKSQEAVADAEITASVKSALLASKKMDTRALNVDTVKGTVFLRGAVPTDQQKALAEQIAKSTVPTESDVVNQLAVGTEPAVTPSPLTP